MGSALKKQDLQHNSELNTLVIQAKQGDRDSFAKIVELTSHRLLKFCIFICGQKQTAEDLVQDAYVKAFRKLHQLQRPETFMGWLFQITKNLFLDQLRSRQKEDQATIDVDNDLENIISCDPTTDIEKLNSIRKILLQFEPDERLLLVLIDIEGHSYEEAAQIVSKSESSVKSNIYRIRQEFIKKWSDS